METETYQSSFLCNLDTNGAEFNELLKELQTVIDKINNFKIKVYSKSDSVHQLDQK